MVRIQECEVQTFNNAGLQIASALIGISVISKLNQLSVKEEAIEINLKV